MVCERLQNDFLITLLHDILSRIKLIQVRICKVATRRDIIGRKAFIKEGGKKESVL